MFVSSFQIISRPDSQSQLQMFTLFSVCHVGGAKSSTNLHWRLHIGHTGLCKFAKNISMNIWSLEERRDRKLGEMPSLFMSYNILFSWLYPLNKVFFFFSLRDSENDQEQISNEPVDLTKKCLWTCPKKQKASFYLAIFRTFLRLISDQFLIFIFFILALSRSFHIQKIDLTENNDLRTDMAPLRGEQWWC